mgnify:CR=1 FL=1
MRKKILYVFLIFMLIINAMLLYMIIEKKGKKDHAKGQTFLMQELNFSEDQKKQFLLLDNAHRKRMMQIDDESQKLRKTLFDSYSVEIELRDSLMTRFGNLEAARQDELFSFFGKVRKLCNEEQAKKFDEIIQRALHRRGPKPPNGKHGGPPPGH